MNNTEHLRAGIKLAETLELMLHGKLSFIEGSRTVIRLVETAGFDSLSEPFVTFNLIDSETDAVPIGKVRDLWDEDAVVRHALDWERSEAYAKLYGEPACHEALLLLGCART